MHKHVKQWADAKVQFYQNHLVANERVQYGSKFEKRAASISKDKYLINQLTHASNNLDDDFDYATTTGTAVKTRNLQDPQTLSKLRKKRLRDMTAEKFLQESTSDEDDGANTLRMGVRN